MSDDALVVFTPSGKRGRFPVGTKVLAAARALGVDIDSVCGGRGICGRCQVLHSTGEFAKHGITSSTENLSPFSALETRALERKKLKPGRRLGCDSVVLSDVVIDIPEESQVHRQVVRKDAGRRIEDIDPIIHLYYIELSKPDLHTRESMSDRILMALSEDWGLEGLTFDPSLYSLLNMRLEKGDYKVTLAVREGREIIAIWSGFQDAAYGVAVDIGTTTIAAHLTNLTSGEVVASSGVMNPQIRFGEDLMSRVSYVQMNDGSTPELAASVRDALSDLVESMIAEADVPLDQVLELVAVGNPIMHHLFLGLDPTPLGLSPFPLALDHLISLPARELNVRMLPSARITMLPCIAGHVGADTAGVILSEKPYEKDPVALLIDVGTNAEIVLGNKEQLLACSSPTGPAFEGAQVTCGQRAAPGAIERIRIDPETAEPRYKVIGCDLWSDDPGFEKAVETIGVTGICGSGIIEVIAEMFVAGLIATDGLIKGSGQEKTDRIVQEGETFSYFIRRGSPEIRVTQVDIRNIQLAKAAVHAGARLLMDKLGRTEVDEVVLAGAFGSYIDPKYAMILGLVPDCALEAVRSAGNAAGTGALTALLNKQARTEISRVVKQVEKIETAIEDDFQSHFVEAMAFPHKTQPYTNLRAIVTLPEADAGEAGQGRRRRRRRG